MRAALFAFASVLALTACSQPAAQTDAPAESEASGPATTQIAAPVYPETRTVEQVEHVQHVLQRVGRRWRRD